MTTFNRLVYLKRVSQLALAAINAARDQGMAISDSDMRRDLQAASATSHAAFGAFLDALYDELPDELDGAKLKARAA